VFQEEHKCAYARDMQCHGPCKKKKKKKKGFAQCLSSRVHTLTTLTVDMNKNQRGTDDLLSKDFVEGSVGCTFSSFFFFKMKLE